MGTPTVILLHGALVQVKIATEIVAALCPLGGDRKLVTNFETSIANSDQQHSLACLRIISMLLMILPCLRGHVVGA